MFCLQPVEVTALEEREAELQVTPEKDSDSQFGKLQLGTNIKHAPWISSLFLFLFYFLFKKNYQQKPNTNKTAIP